MVRVRHLVKAPIVEAIIDIRTRLPEGFKVKELLLLKKELATRYPKMEQIRRYQRTIEIKDGVPSTINKRLDRNIYGYRLISSDKKDIAQFRLDGFSFSRLAPYTYWKKYYGESQVLWDYYNKTTKPILVDRISLRYINKFDIPLPVELVDYFTASPVLPDSLPQKLGHFFTRMSIREDDLSADIVQTFTKSKKENHIGYILDIDVHKEDDKGIKQSIFPSYMKRMRELKNRLFFELITKRTLRLLK